MSPWSTVALSVAIFSTLLYTCLSAYIVTGIFLYRNMYAEPQLDDDPDVRMDENRAFRKTFNVTSIWISIVELVIYIVMLSFSILLIVGVKKQRYQCMPPWLCTGGILIVAGLWNLYCTRAHTSDFKYILDVTTLGLQAVLWFPVYTCYKKMHKSSYWKQSGFIQKVSVAGNTRVVKKSVFSKVGFSVCAKNRT